MSLVGKSVRHVLVTSEKESRMKVDIAMKNESRMMYRLGASFA